ncbi:MAG: peptidoglycan-binding protein [Mycobacteriales bacterium]|jgi:peptidoglycan hydrolase-like protein with peptidoglycan-binding domain
MPDGSRRTRRLLLSAAVGVLALVGTAAMSSAARADTVSPALCSTTLQQGSSGSCVSELQTRLNQLGAHLSVDGNFGPATRNAVEAFQGRSSIGVDGIVGPTTRSHLDSPGGVTLDTASASQVQSMINSVFGSAAPTALRVARCESSYNEIAINRNTNGTRDYGIFQLNDGGTLQGLGGDAHSALYASSNISMAHTLYLQRGWQPWSSSQSCWG